MSDEERVVHLVDLARGIPVSGTEQLADWLRSWAEGLRTGDYGAIKSLVVLVENSDGEIGQISQSTSSMDGARVMGLLHFAAHLIADGECLIEDLRDK